MNARARASGRFMLRVECNGNPEKSSISDMNYDEQLLAST